LREREAKLNRIDRASRRCCSLVIRFFISWASDALPLAALADAKPSNQVALKCGASFLSHR
jgi:hypothetical protein